MEKLNIAGRLVGAGEPPYIVAEIGSNHNGDMDLCKRLIDAAKDCGADAAKFQSWSKWSLISKAEYARNTKYGTDHAKLPSLEDEVEKYQLNPEQHREVAEHCRKRDITFFSSCFSSSEIELLESLDVPAYKIASMDVNHLPLLERVAQTRKPVILSTGLATLGEIERALSVLREGGAGEVALLHCVSIYPSAPEIVNLRNMATMQSAFDVPVGYSDHSIGASIPLAAVALGACIIEKHFTLDKGMEGWDHAVSADPLEMSHLVQESRNVFSSLGSSVRAVNESQLAKRKVFRRRMVAIRSLKKGESLTPNDIDFKRPGSGIRPDELEYVVGRPLLRDLQSEDEIEWADFG
ncbi:MAG: N-acetylneuraminate synthase family protein [Pyrinomonadaceae bacterium]|nr:N-acetylneuraminate synthase family protein [Pyrinomonadaceae bacterium]